MMYLYVIFRIEAKMEATTGGYKIVLTTEKNVTQRFTGMTSMRIVNVTFDLKAPVHCSKDWSCDNDYVLPVDVGIQIDNSVSNL